MIYFAYGSNLNPGQMFDRCPAHRTIGVARMPGHRLVFPRYSQSWGCATAGVEAAGDSNVWGVLYQLGDDDLPVLHYHEGYDPQGPADGNRHDFREVSVVNVAASEIQNVMTYVAVADGTTELPSRRYIDAIMDGVRYHNLPRAWMVYLETIATAD